MSKPVTISKKNVPYRSMDYEALREEGIQRMQELAGSRWTDYNHHDPGVTILEYLCYGITDVGYRCNFPVTDLLYAPENKSFESPENAFFPPEDILPCAPLTIHDYACLLLDRCKDMLDNVWVEPVPGQDGILGLFDIRLQLKGLGQQKDVAQILNTVKAHFVRHRNLGEDIRSVSVLQRHNLNVSAVVEIQPDISANQVLSNIVRQLENFLTPPLRFYSFEELSNAGWGTDQIFDGPAGTHGFIRKDSLRLPTRTVHLSKLRDLLHQTEGVIGIQSLQVLVNGLRAYTEEVNVDDDGYLALDPAMRDHLGSLLQFRRNGQQISVDHNLAVQIWNAAVARDDQQIQPKNFIPRPAPGSTKNLKDIAEYHSMQHFFPAAYGIGAYGIPQEYNDLRLAQARQLKAFLAVFELMPAAYLKQITRLKQCFSTRTNRDATSYFTQFPFSIPDIDPLLVSTDAGDMTSQLARLAARADQPLVRRNAFLDHLLARFGETVPEETIRQYLADPYDRDTLLQWLIDTKCRLLQEYNALSRHRGQGFDYLQPEYGKTEQGVRRAENVPGLKRRICAQLNLPETADRSCTDFFPFQGFQQPGKSADSGLPLKALLRTGANSDHYEVEKKDQEWRLYFKKDNRTDARFVFSSPSQSDLRNRLNEFLKAIEAFDAHSSNFFVVEHVLLRPLSGRSSRLVFSVPLGTEKVVFESAHFFDLKTWSELSDSLLVIASNPKNLRTLVDPTNEQQEFLVIHLSEQEILVSTQSFARAEQRREAVLAHMQQILKDDPEQINELILPDQQQALKKIDVQGLNFYGPRISVAIPDWPSRFSSRDLQKSFEKLVVQHLPAHLHVDFLWLSWPQMQQFEKYYFAWLEKKADPAANIAVLDGASYELAKCLQGHLYPNEENAA